MIYDPKEVEKWQKIQGSKNPLNDLRRQFRTGKLNRSDIPLIKHIIRYTREEKEEEKELVESLIKELEDMIKSIDERDE
jgi:hypothetical protein